METYQRELSNFFYNVYIGKEPGLNQLSKNSLEHLDTVDAIELSLDHLDTDAIGVYTDWFELENPTEIWRNYNGTDRDLQKVKL